MSQELSELTKAILASAKKAGAESADALAVSGNSLSIDVLGGKLEHAERSEGVDIGLRVLLGNRQACVSSSDVRPETLTKMAQRAVAMAKEAPEDGFAGLADPSQFSVHRTADGLELADGSAEPSPAKLEEDALGAEAAALNVKGVSQVQGSSANYYSNAIHLSTSNGFSGGYHRTGHSVSCVAISGEGQSMERDYFGESRVYQSDLPDVALIGRKAGERAVSRSGARKPPTGAFPVLFDERVASSLIGHLLGAINGSAIVRGSSWLRDSIGKPVLPSGIFLTEDPLRKRISGSKPFDAEGLPVECRYIVKDGVLTGWTLDLATARRLGLESTGNATRGTSAPPTPSAGNMAITQGPQSRDDLIAEMGTGLIITSLIGSSVNPNSGDYSRGANGYWVENGEITRPVNECTIAGNLKEMLLSIRPANDARPHLSRTIPSLLVEGLTIAGE